VKLGRGHCDRHLERVKGRYLVTVTPLHSDQTPRRSPTRSCSSGQLADRRNGNRPSTSRACGGEIPSGLQSLPRNSEFGRTLSTSRCSRTSRRSLFPCHRTSRPIWPSERQGQAGTCSSRSR
jgi:hypothetical protein